MTEMPQPYRPVPPVAPGRRNRPVPLIIGVLLLLVAVPLLLAGAGLGWVLAQRDDGFFSTPSEGYSSPTVAIASDHLAFGELGPTDWWPDGNLATLRLSAQSPDSDVFVGIAPSSDVERYLGPAGYDQISDITAEPFRAALTRRGGDGVLDGPPTEQTFWTAQTSGSGTQTLTWDLQPGTYTMVVMNADGTPGVTADLMAGARVDLVVPLAWTLGVAGALLLVGGVLLIIYGARPPRPRTPATTYPTMPAR